MCNAKVVMLLTIVIGFGLAGCASMKPHLVLDATDADHVAGCGEIQYKVDKYGKLLELQLLRSYPAGAYDDLLTSAMKKARYDTIFYGKTLLATVYVEDYGKPVILAPECRAHIGAVSP